MSRKNVIVGLVSGIVFLSFAVFTSNTSAADIFETTFLTEKFYSAVTDDGVWNEEGFSYCKFGSCDVGSDYDRDNTWVIHYISLDPDDQTVNDIQIGPAGRKKTFLGRNDSRFPFKCGREQIDVYSASGGGTVGYTWVTYPNCVYPTSTPKNTPTPTSTPTPTPTPTPVITYLSSQACDPSTKSFMLGRGFKLEVGVLHNVHIEIGTVKQDWPVLSAGETASLGNTFPENSSYYWEMRSDELGLMGGGATVELGDCHLDPTNTPIPPATNTPKPNTPVPPLVSTKGAPGGRFEYLKAQVVEIVETAVASDFGTIGVKASKGLSVGILSGIAFVGLLWMFGPSVYQLLKRRG